MRSDAPSRRRSTSGRAAPTTRTGKAPTRRPRILLEGRPGVGKTTVAVRLAGIVRERGLSLTGFVTEELREGRRRVGFAVETFAGERATLAHVTFSGPPRVGRYGVDLEAFERVALPALAGAGEAQLVLIDELGKMELASEAFRDAVSELFRGRLPVIATVHVMRHPFTDALKQEAELIQVTHRNRDDLPGDIAARFPAPPPGNAAA
jgi:nucleoside-triphosphatase